MTDSGQRIGCRVAAIPSAEHEKKKFSNAGTGDNAEIEEIHKRIACFVVSEGLPFEMVESRAYIRLMHSLRPQFELPSAPALSKICHQLYLDEKLKLQNFMKMNCQSVCLSTDCWNSPQGITYMCITAHFIDENWKLKRKVLSFLLNDFIRGLEIGDAIKACLAEWGIKRVCTITMDNAVVVNDHAIAYLKAKFGISGSSYIQVKCIVRMINSVVDEALQKAAVSVDRVRCAIDYVKFYPSRLKKFNKCVEAEKIESADCLHSDHGGRWKLTYTMLSRAEKYEKAFDSYAKLDPNFELAIEDGLPSSSDWSVVRHLTVVLKPFYDIMLNISKSLNLTSNTFWVDISDLYATFLAWQNGSDSELRAIAKEMWLKLEEYFGGYEKMNKIVYIASVLDPRLKFKVLEYALCQIYGEKKGGALFKDIKEAMFKMFDEYKRMVHHKVVDKSKSHSGNPRAECNNIFLALYKKRGSESELEVYLIEAMEDDRDDFDVLEWWKCNSEKFPILSHMARDILAIPKSTVVPDFAFNIHERKLEEFRGDLDPDTLQGLMCGQDWLQGPPLEGAVPKEDGISREGMPINFPTPIFIV